MLCVAGEGYPPLHSPEQPLIATSGSPVRRALVAAVWTMTRKEVMSRAA